MKESAFQTELVKWLRAHNAYVLNTSGSAYGTSGIADLNIVHSHLSNLQCWLELKIGKNPLKPLQKQFLDAMRSRGVDAYCCRLFIEQENYQLCYTLVLEDWSRAASGQLVQWTVATIDNQKAALRELFARMWRYLTEVKRDGLRTL